MIALQFGICPKKRLPRAALGQTAMHRKSVERFDVAAFPNTAVWRESELFKKSYIAVLL